MTDELHNYRSACSITDTDSVVVTGGWPATSRVSRYHERGFLEDLPSLITARDSHACAMYTTDRGTKV